MWTILRDADSLLRQTAWPVKALRPASVWWRLAVLIVVFGGAYGAVMGSFGGVTGERIWQVIFSASKVPILLLATFAIALPSYFVLNTLLGLRNDFAEALRALLAGQAGLTIILAALAPLTAFWYASTASYQKALLFNGLMFAVASASSQIVLGGYYRRLVLRNAKHRWMLRVWLFLYAFVGIQMAWVLRPFVGTPNEPTQFIRSDVWSNAYVIVFRLVWNAIGEWLPR